MFVVHGTELGCLDSPMRTWFCGFPRFYLLFVFYRKGQVVLVASTGVLAFSSFADAQPMFIVQ